MSPAKLFSFSRPTFVPLLNCQHLHSHAYWQLTQRQPFWRHLQLPWSCRAVLSLPSLAYRQHTLCSSTLRTLLQSRPWGRNLSLESHHVHMTCLNVRRNASNLTGESHSVDATAPSEAAMRSCFMLSGTGDSFAIENCSSSAYRATTRLQ